MLQSLLYFNPVAGRRPISSQRLRTTLDLLLASGIQCEAVASHPRSEGPPQLDLQSKQLLIAMGGDGTIHELLLLAVKHRVTLGILPTGTANVLAGELGIPCQPDRATRVLRDGLRKRIALGRAGSEYFHLMAGIGVDGLVIQRTSSRLKRRLGRSLLVGRHQNVPQHAARTLCAGNRKPPIPGHLRRDQQLSLLWRKIADHASGQPVLGSPGDLPLTRRNRRSSSSGLHPLRVRDSDRPTFVVPRCEVLLSQKGGSPGAGFGAGSARRRRGFSHSASLRDRRKCPRSHRSAQSLVATSCLTTSLTSCQGEVPRRAIPK